MSNRKCLQGKNGTITKWQWSSKRWRVNLDTTAYIQVRLGDEAGLELEVQDDSQDWIKGTLVKTQDSETVDVAIAKRDCVAQCAVCEGKCPTCERQCDQDGRSWKFFGPPSQRVPGSCACAPKDQCRACEGTQVVECLSTETRVGTRNVNCSPGDLQHLTRLVAEKAKQDAEKAKQDAEKAKQNRLAAEKARQDAEKAKQNRLAAEKARQAADYQVGDCTLCKLTKQITNKTNGKTKPCHRCDETGRVPGKYRYFGTNSCEACNGTGRRKDGKFSAGDRVCVLLETKMGYLDRKRAPKGLVKKRTATGYTVEFKKGYYLRDLTIKFAPKELVSAPIDTARTVELGWAPVKVLQAPKDGKCNVQFLPSALRDSLNVNGKVKCPGKVECNVSVSDLRRTFRVGELLECKLLNSGTLVGWTPVEVREAPEDGKCKVRFLPSALRKEHLNDVGKKRMFGAYGINVELTDLRRAIGERLEDETV